MVTLHISGSHKTIIRGISSCFYIQPFGSCGVYVAHLRVPVDWFVVVISLYWCRGGSPVLVALRVPVDWFVVVVSLYWCRGGSPVSIASVGNLITIFTEDARYEQPKNVRLNLGF